MDFSVHVSNFILQSTKQKRRSPVFDFFFFASDMSDPHGGLVGSPDNCPEISDLPAVADEIHVFRSRRQWRRNISG